MRFFSCSCPLSNDVLSSNSRTGAEYIKACATHCKDEFENASCVVEVGRVVLAPAGYAQSLSAIAKSFTRGNALAI
jgi:hypothetical protein